MYFSKHVTSFCTVDKQEFFDIKIGKIVISEVNLRNFRNIFQHNTVIVINFD